MSVCGPFTGLTKPRSSVVQSNRLEGVLAAGLLATSTPAKAARTVNDPPNPELPDDQFLQILMNAIEELDDDKRKPNPEFISDCSTLVALMSVAKTLPQLEQAAALVVSKMKLTSANITGPTPNLTRLRTWCSYNIVIKDFERLCFQYVGEDRWSEIPESNVTPSPVKVVSYLQILDGSFKVKSALTEATPQSQLDLANKVMQGLTKWYNENPERPAFIMRKMAEVMMSRYMSEKRKAYRSEEPLHEWHIGLEAKEDDALNILAIFVFCDYIKLKSTWTGHDVLRVCEILKVLPWMLVGYFPGDTPFVVVEGLNQRPEERRYAYSPWVSFSKHPIKITSIDNGKHYSIWVFLVYRHLTEIIKERFVKVYTSSR